MRTSYDCGKAIGRGDVRTVAADVRGVYLAVYWKMSLAARCMTSC
jgi:hypothetical protein